jgi:hypothetical protein
MRKTRPHFPNDAEINAIVDRACQAVPRVEISLATSPTPS